MYYFILLSESAKAISLLFSINSLVVSFNHCVDKKSESGRCHVFNYVFISLQPRECLLSALSVCIRYFAEFWKTMMKLTFIAGRIACLTRVTSNVKIINKILFSNSFSAPILPFFFRFLRKGTNSQARSYPMYSIRALGSSISLSSCTNSWLALSQVYSSQQSIDRVRVILLLGAVVVKVKALLFLTWMNAYLHT